jgi:hypothetical protein
MGATTLTAALVRVYVDGVAADVPPGCTALDAVRLLDAGRADEILRGARVITDSRGLPVASDTHVFAGAIFRVVMRRRRDG